MATIGVMTYAPHVKLVLTNNNNQNLTTIDPKPLAKHDILIVRKPQKFDNENSENQPDLLRARKKSKLRDNKSSSALPNAVARRNARERNRVKQVNNGFAMLRQHIPCEVAAAFESASGHKSGTGSKKLSKVDTLRMAVEYIRALEDLLALTDGTESITSQNTTSFSLPDDQISLSLSDASTPQQYETFRVLPPLFDEDQENQIPLNDDELMQSDDQFLDYQQEVARVYGSLLSVKREVDDENVMDSQTGEGVIDVMAWWELQQKMSGVVST